MGCHSLDNGNYLSRQRVGLWFWALEEVMPDRRGQYRRLRPNEPGYDPYFDELPFLYHECL